MLAAAPGEVLVRPAAAPQVPADARFGRRAGLDDYLLKLSPALGRAAAPGTGREYTRSGLVTRTTGKVFFTLDGSDYVCSGSAVHSPDKSTVLTAGHCVYDPATSSQATNWAFVPGYRKGTTPYGVFVATRLATTAGWRDEEDFNLDIAFANVGRNEDDDLLTTAVGGQPIAFSPARGRAAYVFGYPAAQPWDGERMIACSGTLQQDTHAAPSTAEGLACTMTPGSSGGPWFASFDPGTGTGTLTSLTSFSYSDQAGVLWGPYLGDVAEALYDAVAGSTTA